MRCTSPASLPRFFARLLAVVVIDFFFALSSHACSLGFPTRIVRSYLPAPLDLIFEWVSQPPPVQTTGSIAGLQNVRCDKRGHSAPLSIQACTSFPAASWLPGAGLRPSPGFHAQGHEIVLGKCSCSATRSLPPLSWTSFSRRQISPNDLPSQVMDNGATPHRG